MKLAASKTHQQEILRLAQATAERCKYPHVPDVQEAFDVSLGCGLHPSYGKEFFSSGFFVAGVDLFAEIPVAHVIRTMRDMLDNPAEAVRWAFLSARPAPEAGVDPALGLRMLAAATHAANDNPTASPGYPLVLNPKQAAALRAFAAHWSLPPEPALCAALEIGLPASYALLDAAERDEN